ncbi:MAG: hypothetical protein FH749_02645 [Firmicutes bacterium]|nr:hypothetical protein [Bacillota bacterium]
MLIILGIVALLVGAVLTPSIPLDREEFAITLELQGDESFYRHDGELLLIDGAMTRLLFGRRTVVGTASVGDMKLQLTSYKRHDGGYILEMTGYDDETTPGLINKAYLQFQGSLLDRPENATLSLTIDNEEAAETFTTEFQDR